MNIFTVSNSVDENVVMLDDVRVRKMLVETAQMLSTAHRLCGGRDDVYKKTHPNHPSTKWVRETLGNYWWTYLLFERFCQEYTYRSGGKTHLSEKKLRHKLCFIPKDIPSGEMTQFANCSARKDLPLFEGYKQTMRDKWTNDKRPPKWTGRDEPTWRHDESSRTD